MKSLDNKPLRGSTSRASDTHRLLLEARRENFENVKR
jgi:hypothetical protein